MIHTTAFLLLALLLALRCGSVDAYERPTHEEIARRAIQPGLPLGLLLLLAPDVAEARDEWRAQIVDAETDQPLQGVVILAYWDRCYPSFGGWAGCEYYDSEEVVTGPDGRFVIHSRWTYEIPFIVRVRGPEYVVFKPGYGQIRTRRAGVKGEGDILQMPPLKTREERSKIYDQLSWSANIPQEKARRLREAEMAERAFLGYGR